VLSIFSFVSTNAFSSNQLAMPIKQDLSHEVITCFADRLGIGGASQEVVLDGIINQCGLELNDTTRTMILGVIIEVSKKYESQQSDFYDIDSIADEVARSIDAVLIPSTQEIKNSESGWLKKNVPWLLAGGAVICAFVLLYYFLQEKKKSIDHWAYKRKKKLEAWYQKRLTAEILKWQEKEKLRVDLAKQEQVMNIKEDANKKLNSIRRYIDSDKICIAEYLMDEK
jgi:hypothetical protein